jgi:NAD(P)-dependent dehydrogenase (short-subunit alcohol dehydrogenase family)
MTDSCVVTGGGRGVGRAMTERLPVDGARSALGLDPEAA